MNPVTNPVTLEAMGEPLIAVTLKFHTFAEAATALAKLGGIVDPADRPDVGAPEPLPLPPAPTPAPTAAPVNPAALFRALGTPLPPAAPLTANQAEAALFGQHANTPPAPPAPPVAPALAASLDVTGLPWDSRIHAESKGQNKDGTWRMKRNVPEDLVARVLREMRAVYPAPVAGATPPAPPTSAALPPAAPPLPPAPPVATPAAVAPPLPPAAPAVAAADPAPLATTFPLFVQKHVVLSGRQPDLYNRALLQALSPFGMTALAQLAPAGADVISAVDAAFCELVK